MSDIAWLSGLGALIIGPLIALFSIQKWGARTVLLAIVLIAYLMPQTQIETPMDTRAVGLGLIAILFVGTLLSGNSEARVGLSSTTFSALGFVLVSSTWSIGSSSATLEQAGTMLALLCLVAIPFEEKELRYATIATVIAIMLASAFMYATDPASLWEANRLRGPMANANNLSLATILCFPALRNIHRFAHFPACATALAVVTLTGSRSALIALVVQIIVSSWSSLRAFGRIIALTLTGLILAYALPTLSKEFHSQGAGSESVLRSNNSRESVWYDSWIRVQEHPWFGGGIGSLTSDFETGSSLFAVWIVSGVIGVVLVAVAVAAPARTAISLRWLGDWRILLIIGGCINAAFEGWLIAAGTMYALIFWLAVEQVQRQARRERGRALSPRPASTGQALPKAAGAQISEPQAKIRGR